MIAGWFGGLVVLVVILRSVEVLVADVVVMTDALRLVVRRKGQNQPHDGLQIAFQDLLRRDLVHSDLLRGHEFQYPLQILPHSLQRFRVVVNSHDFLAGDDFDELRQDFAALKIRP